MVLTPLSRYTGGVQSGGARLAPVGVGVTDEQGDARMAQVVMG